VLSDDGCDKENAAAPGGDGDAGGATLKAAGSLPAANQAVTAVSSAGRLQQRCLLVGESRTN
jgi:hypothetical protein